MGRLGSILLVPIGVVLLTSACTNNNGEGSTSPEPTPSPTQTPLRQVTGEVLVGAGDIANCDSEADEATAALLDSISGTVFTLGDNAYEDGSTSQFAECYSPAWGRHRQRTRPAPGNHDYHASNAEPYFDYFGAAAGKPGEGYYSYDLGGWHVIVLNSNCGDIGGCGPDSAQSRWLATDLKGANHECALAYWHHPVTTIGPHDDDEAGMLALWAMLYDAGVDVVVNGHEHDYQRYQPLNRGTDGIDPTAGIRLFIAGTGGTGLTDADEGRAARKAGLEVWADEAGDGDGRGHDAAFGVIKFTLGDGSYAWEFIPAKGASFTDSGSDNCH